MKVVDEEVAPWRTIQTALDVTREKLIEAAGQVFAEFTPGLCALSMAE
jgi:hypothetical protein